LIGCALFVFPASALAQETPGRDYLVCVLSKSAGKIMLIRLGLRVEPVEREITANVIEMEQVK